MNLSRNVTLFKRIISPAKNFNQVRNSGHAPWVYRRLAAENTPKSHFIARDVLMGYTVWWILWHCYHEPGHLFGEYEYPDPSKWTDAELGIPPDDE